MRRRIVRVLPAFEVVEVLLDLALGDQLQRLERAVEMGREYVIAEHRGGIGPDRAAAVGLPDLPEPPGEEVVEIGGIGALGLRRPATCDHLGDQRGDGATWLHSDEPSVVWIPPAN